MDTFCTYEQHFGLSGPPFSTTPDPDFLFESRGHRQAFTLLSHAVEAGECFMVVTGGTGCGKTMLVRKLLRSIESAGIVAAQPNGTALDARALLLSVLSSFRAPVFGDSLEQLRDALRAFLATLAAMDRKALVVVDEAQHLLPDAIDELVAFATPVWTDDVPLLVLLAGPPALRKNLPNLAALTRPPAFLFCDVGVLTLAETRAYVEHRLGHVHWHRSPSISQPAYERIHRATDGVPRRVNRLCNRLLIVASQHNRKIISPKLVDEVYASLRDEMSFIGPVDGGFQPRQSADRDDFRTDASPSSGALEPAAHSTVVPSADANDSFNAESSGAAAPARDAIPTVFAAGDADTTHAPEASRDDSVFLPQQKRYELWPSVRKATSALAPRIRVAAAEFVPAARNAVAALLLTIRITMTRLRMTRLAPAAFGWLAIVLPLVALALSLAKPTETRVVSTLLGLPPALGTATSNVDAAAPRIARVGDRVDVTRSFVAEPGGQRTFIASSFSALPHEQFLAGSTSGVRAVRIGSDGKIAAHRDVAAGGHGVDRSSAVGANNEVRRAAAATKADTSRATRDAPKAAKKKRAQKSPIRHATQRTDRRLG